MGSHNFSFSKAHHLICMSGDWARDAEIEASIASSPLKDQEAAKKHILGTKTVENPLLDKRAVEALAQPAMKNHPSLNVLGTECFSFDTQDVDDNAPEYNQTRRLLFRSDLDQTPVGKLPNQNVIVSGVSSLFCHDRAVYKSLALDASPKPALSKRVFLKLDVIDLELPAGPVEPIVCQLFVIDDKKATTERWNFYPSCSNTFFSNNGNSNKAAIEITACSPASYLALVYYRVMQADQGGVCNDYYRKPGTSTGQKAKTAVQQCWPRLKDAWMPFAYSFFPIEETKGKFEFPPAIVTDKRITTEVISAQIEKVKSKPDTLPFVMKMNGEFAAVEDVRKIEDDRLLVWSVMPLPQKLVTDYRHELVLSLISGKIDAPGKLNARNIVPEVMFMNGSNEPVKCIRARWGNEGTLTNAFASANYHDKSPQFDDEFIIELPYEIHPDACIVIKYHHASTQEKEAALREVGLSVIKLCSSPGVFVENGVKQTGIHFNMQSFTPSQPTDKNSLTYSTELRSVLVSTNPVVAEILSSKKPVMPRVDEFTDVVLVNRLFVVLDSLMKLMIQAPADTVRNIIKIGRLSSVVKLQYFLDLMDVYASLYALRDKERQTEKFHVALLNGMAKVLPQTMAQSVHVLRFLFRVFVKSLVVTKDRGFGKEFDKFFKVWIEQAPKVAVSPDKMQHVNDALGLLVKLLTDIGFYELAVHIIISYCRAFKDTANDHEAVTSFLGCAVNAKLFIAMSLSDDKFPAFFVSLVESAFTHPDSRPSQNIFGVLAKLFSYVPRAQWSDVAAKYVALLGFYHEGISFSEKNIQTALCVVAFVMRHMPKKEFEEAYQKMDKEKLFKFLHFMLTKTKFVSDDKAMPRQTTTVIQGPASEARSSAAPAAGKRFAGELSEQVFARKTVKQPPTKPVRGSRGSVKMAESKVEELSAGKASPKIARQSVNVTRGGPLVAFSLAREIALEVQFAVLHTLLLILEVSGDCGSDIYEVLYHILSMNICIDVVLTLRDVLYLFTEKHARLLIEGQEPPFTLFAKKLLSLAAVHNETVADLILAVFPRIFAAEKHLYTSNNRTLVCCIRAISLLTDAELESPVILQAMKKRSDAGGNMDQMTECLGTLADLNREMKILDPAHFAEMRKTGTCGGASNPEIIIERYADCIYERAKAMILSPDAVAEQVMFLASYNQKNGHLSEAFMGYIYVCGLIIEYLSILKRIRSDSTVVHPGSFFADICPKLNDALCPDFILEDLPDVPTYCNSGSFSESAAFVALQDAFQMARDSNLFEYACRTLNIASSFLENDESYSQLAKLYRNQAELYSEIKNKPSEEMRLLGKYYRVTFYGSYFGKDDGKTFIYREVKLTHLLDVTGRLLAIYRKLHGNDNIEVLTESGMIDRRLLRTDKGYIQITAVKPYFGKDELRDRETVFEENSNVSQFKFEAPFVKGEKKIQGGVDTQWLRRTILRTVSVIPSIVKREIVPPCGYIVMEYEPIRVSCKQMKERLAMYYVVINKKDMPALFPLLQGSLLAQVNEGPLKIAEVFLSSGPRTKYTEKLRDLFRQFLMLNETGLELVKEYVKTDPTYGSLLTMMIEGMDNLRTQMTPYLTAQPASA